MGASFDVALIVGDNGHVITTDPTDNPADRPGARGDRRVGAEDLVGDGARRARPRGTTTPGTTMPGTGRRGDDDVGAPTTARGPGV